MDDAIAWGGISLCPGAGGPARYLQLHLHQEDSVMVGEDLVYSLTVPPFINSVSCLLCQPPFWGCQSRPKLVPQEAEAAKAKGSCSHYWRRRIHLRLVAEPILGLKTWRKCRIIFIHHGHIVAWKLDMIILVKLKKKTCHWYHWQSNQQESTSQ